MPEVVDDAVVKLEFDNGQYNKNVQESITYTEALKESIDFSGLKNSFTPLLNGVNELRGGFSTASVVAISLMNRLTNDMVNGAQRIINSAIRPLHKMMTELTSVPMKSGLEEYELKMNSIQTIMASTGESIDTVNKHLDELNKYSDLTIYSFRDMTSNIGKFTNAGVKLDVAVNAMKGLLNEAALSGANATEASRAMYNLAQSLSMGYVQYIDWKSIENANMATIDFKRNLAQTAIEMGKLKKGTDGLYSTGKHTFTLQQLFKDGMKDQWLQSEVLTTTLEKYTDTTTELGRKAQAAAQDMKTFTQMVQTIREALQSGWAGTWQQIFGDLIEAKALWTTIGGTLNDLIGNFDDFRNAILKTANALPKGFRQNLIDSVFNVMTGLGRILYSVKTAFEDFINSLDGRRSLSITLRIAQWVSNLSVKIKELSEIFLTNADTQRTLHAVFRATFSVGELVWRIFTELSSAATDLAAKTQPLITAFRNVVLLSSIMITAGVDWLKNSGKITSTIDFIKTSIISGAMAIGGVIKSITDSQAFISFIDSIKVAVKQLWDFINGFSINFKGTSFEWLAEIFESLKNQEFNVSQFEVVLARIFGGINNIASKVLAGLPTILAPVYSAFQVIMTFVKNILLTMDAQSLAEFAKILVELIRLPAQLIKWTAIKDLIGGAVTIMNSIGGFIRDWGSLLRAQAFSIIAESFTFMFSALGNIFLKLGAFIGILVASAFILKKYKLLPQFLVVFGSLAAFIVGLTVMSHFIDGQTRNIDTQNIFGPLFRQVSEMETPLMQVVRLTGRMILMIGALTAAAYILKDVDSAVETIGIITASVLALTGAAALMVSKLDDPSMTTVTNANQTAIISRLGMVESLITDLTLSIIGISAAAKIAGKENWSSILALTGAAIVITEFAANLASRMSTVNASGFDTKTFYTIFGMINAMIGSMIVSMGAFAILSNLISSIGKYASAVGASIVLFAALEGLYWGANKLTPLNWSHAADVLALCALFVIEMSYTIGTFGILSRLIGSIPKYLASIVGASILFAALEGLSAVLIEVSKLLNGDSGQIWSALLIFTILSAVSMAAFAFFTAIEHFVNDVGKYFKMVGVFTALILSIELIMLSFMGLGYLVGKTLDVVGIIAVLGGALAGLVGLGLFAIELGAILSAFAGVYTILEAFGGSEKFTNFLNDISKFFLSFAGLAVLLDMAGVLVFMSLAALIPLLLFPVELGIVIAEFAELANLFGESMKSINDLTADAIDIFTNLSTIVNTLNETANVVLPAKDAIKGLIPFLAFLVPVFAELEVLSLIFSEFGNTSGAVDEVLRNVELLMPIMQNLAKITGFAVDAFAGVKSLILLVPFIGVLVAEFVAVSETMDVNFDYIEKSLKQLLKVFKFVTDDVANGIVNTAKSLNVISSIDIPALLKTAIIGKIASALNKIMPWMTDLNEFIDGLATFASKMISVDYYTSRIKDWNGVIKLLSVVDKVTKAMGDLRIRSLSTAVGVLFGSNDLGELGDGLAGFAASLLEIDSTLDGLNIDTDSPIDKLLTIVSKITKSLKFFNMRGSGLTGIVTSLFVGGNSLSMLGKELYEFTKKFIMVSDLLTFDASGIDTSDWEMLEKAVEFIHTVVVNSAGVWNFSEMTSLVGSIFGNNSIGRLGMRLYEYAIFFKKFYQVVDTMEINDEKLSKMSDTVKWLSDNVTEFQNITATLFATGTSIAITLVTTLHAIIDTIFDSDEKIETGFDRFMNHLNKFISNIGVVLSLIVDAFTQPLNALSPMVVAAFEHLEQPLIDFIAFMTTTVGNVDWLNAFTAALEKACEVVKDLTVNAIIPLLQNGLIPLEKLRIQSKFLPQLASIIKLLIVLASIIAGIIALGLAVKLGIIILLIASVVKGLKGVTSVLSVVSIIASSVISWIGEQFSNVIDELKKKWEEFKEKLNIGDSIKVALDGDFDFSNLNIWKSLNSAASIAGENSGNVFAQAMQTAIDLWDMTLPAKAIDALEELYGKYQNGTAQTQYEAAMQNAQPSRGGTGYRVGTEMLGRKNMTFSEIGEMQGELDKEEYDEAYWKAYASAHFNKTAVAYQEKAASMSSDEHFWENYVKTQDTKAYNYIKAQRTYSGKAADEYLKYLNKGLEDSWEHEYAHVNFKNDDQYIWLKDIIHQYLGWNSDMEAKAISILDEYYPKVRTGFSTFGDMFSVFGGFEDIFGGKNTENMLEEMEKALSGATDGLGDYGDKTTALHEKQLLSESAYWAQLLELKKQGADGAKYQDMALADFEEEILNHVNEVYDNYINTYQSKVSQFENLGSIFNKVDFGFDPENPFTKEDLFGNLQDQITQLDRYADVMASLNDRIDTAELRDTINNMGVDSLEELEALNSLTEAELDNYEAMFVSKMESAARTADVVTRDLYENSMAEIANTIGMPDLPADEIFEWFNGTLTSFDNMMASRGLEFGKIGENVTAGITEGMLNDTSLQATDEAGEQLAENLEEGIEDPLMIESPSRLMEHNVGEMITAGIAKGMTNASSVSKIAASVALVCAWYKSEFNEKITDFEECGRNLMRGLERGINAGMYAATYATGVSADSVYNVYPQKFLMHSPSKVFEMFGNYLMEGLSIGVKNGTSDAEKTMETSANSTLGIMQSAVERAYAAMNSESVPAITPVVNMNKLQNGLRTMDTALAAQRSYLMANAANASIDTSVHKEVSINNQAAVDAITRLNGDILNLGDRLANMQIMLDTGIVAGQMAPAMNSELGTLMSRSIREGVG